MVETRIRAESAIAINLLASPAIMNQQIPAKGAIANTAIKAGRIGDERRIREGAVFVHGYLLYFAGTSSRNDVARIDKPPASLRKLSNRLMETPSRRSATWSRFARHP